MIEQRLASAWTHRSLAQLVLLALLLAALAGWALSQPVSAGHKQSCVSQQGAQHGSLGAGGLIVPLRAWDPTDTNHAGALYGVRGSDGAIVWSCASSTYAGWDDAQLVNGVIYALAGTVYTRDSPPQTEAHAIYAIRPQDGSQLWSFSFQAGSSSTLAFDHGLLFVAAYTADGASGHSILYAIHATDGTLAWTASFGRSIGQPEETVGQPIIVGHHLIVSASSANGQELRGLNESNGSTLWTYALVSAYAPGLWLSLNGVFYFGDGDTLHALDGATGKIRWTQPGFSFSDVYSQLFTAQGTMLFSASESVYAYDLTSGAQRWSAVVGDQPQLMAVTSRAAYVVTKGSDATPGHILALNTSTGDALWERVAPFAGAVTSDSSGGMYLTLAAGPHMLSDVVALDSQGDARWTYSGTSPDGYGQLIPTDDAVYYVWQWGADDTVTTTYVTHLRASDGAALWTTALGAYNTLPLAPLLVA